MRVVLLLTLVALCRGGEWVRYGNHLNNDRWASDETIISNENVGNLQELWSFEAGDGQILDGTPTVLDNNVYITTSSNLPEGGLVINLNFTNGEVIWSRHIPEFTGLPGDFSRSSPTISEDGNLLFIASNKEAVQIAVNRATGDLAWETRITTLECAKVVASPIEASGILFVPISSGSQTPQDCPFARGMLAALDPATGATRWIFETIQGTYTNPLDAATGASIWGRSPAIDIERNLVFVGTGQSYTLPAASHACERNRKPGDPLCTPRGTYSNSVLAIDMLTGVLKWQAQLSDFDAWYFCPNPNDPNCPSSSGSDFDVGQGAILYTADVNGTFVDVVGAGQKSGEYRMINRVTGDIMWTTLCGPGGKNGGLELGSSVDDSRIYTASSNSDRQPWTLVTDPSTTISGSHFNALDKNTGEILWETVVPDQNSGARAHGPTTVANGVMYASITNPEGGMYALNAATGQILFEHNCGTRNIAAPAIVDGIVLWGCGYTSVVSKHGQVIYGQEAEMDRKFGKPDLVAFHIPN